MPTLAIVVYLIIGVWLASLVRNYMTTGGLELGRDWWQDNYRRRPIMFYWVLLWPMCLVVCLLMVIRATPRWLKELMWDE